MPLNVTICLRLIVQKTYVKTVNTGRCNAVMMTGNNVGWEIYSGNTWVPFTDASLLITDGHNMVWDEDKEYYYWFSSSRDLSRRASFRLKK
jgi:hypothetical protein